MTQPPASPAASPQRLPGSLWTLLACQAILVAGIALSYPFMALYLNRDRGLPMSVVGLCLSAMMCGAGLAHALGGELADLYGANVVMEFALVSRGVAALGLAWAIRARAPISAVVGFLILGGCCGNFFDPGIRSWIADHVPPARRSTLYGYQRMAVNLGWGLGPALGGLMAGRSYALMFEATTAACLACLALLRLRMPREAPARFGEAFDPLRLREAAGDRRLLEFCLFTVAVSTVMAQLVASLSVFAVSNVGLTDRQVGYLFALNGLLVTAIQPHVTRGVYGKPLTAALATGCLFYAGGYAGVGFAQGFLTMALAVVLVTCGEALVTPSLNTIAANLAPERLRGRYVGLHGFSQMAGQALGPLLGGFALERLAPAWAPWPWLLVAALAVTASLGFARFARHLNDEEQGLAAPIGALEA